jgi:feruloyl esterase
MNHIFCYTQLSVFLVALSSIASAQTFADQTKCTHLTALTIPTVTIQSAAIVPAGPFEIPGRAAQHVRLPEFCRVAAIARPTSDSEIKFEVWIPSKWNGRFEGVGTGGFSGAISYAEMSSALNSGYATASTDAGHTGDQLAFGQGHPEKIIDWGYRSIHVMTDIAKLIIRDVTGKLPEHSYFNGCATGGHQAMMEVQRYPSDYDGAIAGDPAADRVHEIDGYLGVWLATHDADGKSLLPNAKLQLITRAAVAKCDKLDGVADGVIDDPGKCGFDPAELACKGGDSESCLTEPQVAAAKKVYSGVRNPRTQATIFPGWPVGSEGWAATPNGGWDQMVNVPQPRRGEFFRYFVFDDPNWQWSTFDFDRDVTFADQQMGFLAAKATDITRFTSHGGKLIMYTGLVDPILPADDVTEYYEAIAKQMGGAIRSKDFVRYFKVPGMGHCSGGPGTTQFDMMPELQAWVEQGRAPERVIASRLLDDKTTRTRPLCLYPKVARWSGKGSSDDAANFSCVLVQPVHPH